jgi:hypothetical protein
MAEGYAIRDLVLVLHGFPLLLVDDLPGCPHSALSRAFTVSSWAAVRDRLAVLAFISDHPYDVPRLCKLGVGPMCALSLSATDLPHRFPRPRRSAHSRASRSTNGTSLSRHSPNAARHFALVEVDAGRDRLAVLRSGRPKAIQFALVPAPTRPPTKAALVVFRIGTRPCLEQAAAPWAEAALPDHARRLRTARALRQVKRPGKPCWAIDGRRASAVSRADAGDEIQMHERQGGLVVDAAPGIADDGLRFVNHAVAGHPSSHYLRHAGLRGSGGLDTSAASIFPLQNSAALTL